MKTQIEKLRADARAEVRRLVAAACQPAVA